MASTTDPPELLAGGSGGADVSDTDVAADRMAGSAALELLPPGTVPDPPLPRPPVAIAMTPPPRGAAQKCLATSAVDRTVAATAGNGRADKNNRARSGSLARTVFAATASKQLRTTFKLTRAATGLAFRSTSRAQTSGGNMWLSGDADVAVKMDNGTQGQLEFETGRTVLNHHASSLEEARQARFLRLHTVAQRFDDMEPADQVDRVTLLREVVQFMRYSWRLRMPSVMFSVTGSATAVSTAAPRPGRPHRAQTAPAVV